MVTEVLSMSCKGQKITLRPTVDIIDVARIPTEVARIPTEAARIPIGVARIPIEVINQLT